MAVMWSLIIGLFLLVLPLAPSSSSSMTFKLLGSVYPEGHFYVVLPIGEPPKPYFLDIDTGSNLTWLECNYKNHCESCNQVPHPLYVPKEINLKVPCNHNYCTALREDVDSREPPCSRTDRHRCHYRVRYADGSSSEGMLANDLLFFPERNEKKVFLFGCGYKQHPLKPSPVDGLLGLGMGQIGFVKQLRSRGLITKNNIGHCMSIKGKGYLKIGDFALPSDGVTWIHMTKSGYHYSPGKATLLFDEQQTSTKEMKVLFDSGATYTYMPAPAYRELVTKVKATLSKSLTEVHDAMDLCWKGKKPFKTVDDVKGEFKPLALKFDEHHRLDIPPENYLIVTQKGNVCLGIINGSTERSIAGVYVIGDVTMQDLLVIYDNETEKLGWVRSNCITSESESAINSRL